MKKIFFFLLFPLSLAAQNLVPNPSFEDTILCPFALDQIYYALGWSSFINGTPDYFSNCSNPGPSEVGVPSNIIGYQFALDGNKYAGIITYTYDSTALYREIVGAHLLNTLSIGTRYYATAYFSRADSILESCATNKIGFRFSTVAYDALNPVPIDNFSHIHSDSIITDKINWKLIGGSFVADSAYQYIMIGNFYDDAHTDTFDCSPDGFYGYYYLDGVCVSTDSLLCTNWIGLAEINSHSKKLFFYPTPVNTTLNIDNPLKDAYYSLINLTGESVLKGKLFSGQNRINVSIIPNGIYFLEFNNYYYKILIIHK